MQKMLILSKMARFYSMKKFSSRVRSECTARIPEFQMSAEQVLHLLSSSMDRRLFFIAKIFSLSAVNGAGDRARTGTGGYPEGF